MFSIFVCARRAALLLALAIVGCNESSVAPDDPGPPWIFRRAVDVNNAGTVVGLADWNGQSAGAIWTRGRILTVIDEVNTFVGINDSGTAVGVVRGVGSPPTAYSWNEADGVMELGPFIPTAIDETGTVIGYVRDDIALTRTPVIVRPGESLEYLTEPAALSQVWNPARAVPTDVSGGRIVVGTLGNWAEAFIWTDTGGAQLLFPHRRRDYESTATGVNSRGWVVGWSDELNKAYVWRGPGNRTVLEPLPDAPLWRAMTCATDIRDDGLVVGTSLNRDGQLRAVVWSSDGVLRDLGPGRATAVNGSGMIVGHALYGSHAIVWLPDGTRLDLAGPYGTTLPTPENQALAGGSHVSERSRSLPCP